MLRRTFRAMGTDVELLLDGEAGRESVAAFAAAELEFHRLEALLSRFRPDSELSRLNEAGELAAGPELREVVALAVAARERTGGRFDPTVHDALAAAGYDRSFELVEADGPARPGGAACGGAVEIEEGTIRLGPGVHLDLGGIGKGYAVDRACDMLAAAGPCLVSAGGDLACRGGSWPVGVTDELTVELTRGALATSGRDRRRWRSGGEERHHLIDPATGRPAESELVRVTVWASTAADAEVLAKAAFLGAEVGVPRVLVTSDGRTLVEGGLA